MCSVGLAVMSVIKTDEELIDLAAMGRINCQPAHRKIQKCSLVTNSAGKWALTNHEFARLWLIVRELDR